VVWTSIDRSSFVVRVPVPPQRPFIVISLAILHSSLLGTSKTCLCCCAFCLAVVFNSFLADIACRAETRALSYRVILGPCDWLAMMIASTPSTMRTGTMLEVIRTCVLREFKLCSRVDSGYRRHHAGLFSLL